ncbi:MAG: arylsulfatase [Bryobacteraceae bacterium]|nr:arylsulfatase [Bryobacteraceae bacterium]
MHPPNRRQFVHSAAAALFGAPALLAQPRRPPNVIVLLTDDQGYGDFACHGNPLLKTPNIDRIHGESVRFTDFHVAPMCTPTRGELLTGVDALRNRATSVTAGRAVVRRDIPIMSDYFAQSGYSTGLFGKWHVGDNFPYRPMDRGFQESVYFLGWGLSSAPEFDNDYFDGRYRHRGAVKQFPGYCTDFWFSQAMDWMGQQSAKRQPFFCYLPTNVPHGPQWVDPRYSDPYRRKGVPAEFFGMIANADENVGRLDEFLSKSGLRENTIVVFMTDNGGTAGVNFYNAGMRGRKTQYWEGGHRVPCFIRHPAGKFGAPRDVTGVSQIQDILPTMIDLCDLKRLPSPVPHDGTSLAPALRDSKKALPDRTVVVQYGQHLKPFDCCVAQGRWRLVGRDELYNLDTDFAQANNVAAQNPEVLARLRGRYEKWWEGVEPLTRGFLPISIGSSRENPVMLSSSDWQDIYLDNHRTVSAGDGGAEGGPWTIRVESSGTYEISLARWPFERALALDAPCPEKKMRVAVLPAGKALPIAGARLRVGSHDLSAKTKPGDLSASFTVKLSAGPPSTMHGWFLDGAGAGICGAYYAKVRTV